MTVTYTNDPGGSSVDHVRLLIGDTDCTAGVARLSDEEIQFRLDTESSDELAAWRSVQDIVSALSGKSADWGAGSQRQQKSQTLDHYRKLEKELRTRGAGEFAAPTAGGLSRAEKLTNEEDGDLVQATFRTGQFRNRRKGQTNPQTSLKEPFE